MKKLIKARKIHKPTTAAKPDRHTTSDVSNHSEKKDKKLRAGSVIKLIVGKKLLGKRSKRQQQRDLEAQQRRLQTLKQRRGGAVPTMAAAVVSRPLSDTITAKPQKPVKLPAIAAAAPKPASPPQTNTSKAPSAAVAKPTTPTKPVAALSAAAAPTPVKATAPKPAIAATPAPASAPAPKPAPAPTTTAKPKLMDIAPVAAKPAAPVTPAAIIKQHEGAEPLPIVTFQPAPQPTRSVYASRGRQPVRTIDSVSRYQQPARRVVQTQVPTQRHLTTNRLNLDGIIAN